MRHVQWSTDALEDLKHQIAHIAEDNPDAAQRVANSIRAAGNSLGDFATGRPGRVSGTYEKSISRLPYVIAYTLSEGDQVVSIVRVIHTSRNWLPEKWPA